MTCQRRSSAGQRLRNQAGIMVPAISMFRGDHTMAMTATERSRVLRERRASGKIVLTVVVSEDELGEIGRLRRGGLDGPRGTGSGRQLVP
jgi:hypothetical protein